MEVICMNIRNDIVAKSFAPRSISSFPSSNFTSCTLLLRDLQYLLITLYQVEISRKFKKFHGISRLVFPWGSRGGSPSLMAIKEPAETGILRWIVVNDRKAGMWAICASGGCIPAPLFCFVLFCVFSLYFSRHPEVPAFFVQFEGPACALSRTSK